MGCFSGRLFSPKNRGVSTRTTKRVTVPFSNGLCHCVCVCVFVATKFRAFEQKKSDSSYPTLSETKISPEKSTVGRRNFLFGWPIFRGVFPSLKPEAIKDTEKAVRAAQAAIGEAG